MTDKILVGGLNPIGSTEHVLFANFFFFVTL